jgi:hypothetical protein
MVEVKNVWSYASTPPYISMTWCFIKHRIHISWHGTQLSTETNLPLTTQWSCEILRSNFSLMAITNKPVEKGRWSFMWRHIINSPKNFNRKFLIVQKSVSQCMYHVTHIEVKCVFLTFDNSSQRVIIATLFCHLIVVCYSFFVTFSLI